MSDLVFANDMPDERQIEAIMQWMLRPSEARLWSLIDLALLDHAVVASFARRNGLPMTNAFARSDLAAFGDKAPYFLEMPDDEASQCSITGNLIQLAGNVTALSWLRSGASESALQNTFAYLGKVKIENRKMPIHCRFADTRVLPGLLDTLSAEQRERVASTIESWCWTDRQGALASWRLDTTKHGEKEEGPLLRLSKEQFRRMQREAEPDAIFLMLNQKTPEIVPRSGLGKFHARLRDFLVTANGFGVRDLKDRLQFVVLSLTCGEDFHATPELQPTWKSISEAGASLSKLMQDWSDDMWRRLDAMDGKTG